jgi:hypothetical protein
VFSDGNQIYAGTAGATYSGTDGLFSSSNNGETWTQMYTSNEVSGIVSFNNNLFIATAGDGVAKYDKQNGYWQTYKYGNFGLPPGPQVSAIGAVGSTLFAGIDDGTFSGADVYRSTDNAATWSPTHVGYPVYYSTLAFATSGSYLFAATNDGVYCTTDLGTSWHFVGLKGRNVHSLLVAGDQLYAGCIQDVVYHGSIADIVTQNGVQDKPQSTDQLRTSPNPASESATIIFTSPEAGHAEISIVNLLGTEVSHLFSGELGATEHHFTWNTDGTSALRVPDGMYECLVRMNGRVETLPVVVAR